MKDEIQINPMRSDDLEKAFQLYKEALTQIVDEAFGWDENFQKKRFQNSYKLEWFHWVYKSSHKIGYICFHKKQDEMHLSLLIISDAFRGQSFGQQVMAMLHQRARSESCKVTLSSFIANKRALSFYQKLGYRIENQDEHFYNMVLEQP